MGPFADIDCATIAVAPTGPPGSMVIVGGKYNKFGFAQVGPGAVRTNIGSTTGPVALAAVGPSVYAVMANGINSTSGGRPQVVRVWPPYTGTGATAYVTGRLSAYNTGAYTGTMALPANTKARVVYNDGAWALVDDTTIAIT